MKKLKKICQVVERSLIKLTIYILPELYKRLYPNYLRRIGVRIPLDYRDNNNGVIAPSAYFDGNDYSLISVGKNTTISMDVVILTHDYSIARGFQAIGERNNVRFLRPVTIGANCFIGARSVLLPGTEIGDNSIVGAGSVVRGKIPANSVAVGNPATVVSDTESWARKHLEKGDYVLT